MKHYIHVVFILSVVLILFQGCKRKAPNDAPNNSANAHNEIKAESGIENSPFFLDVAVRVANLIYRYYC